MMHVVYLGSASSLAWFIELVRYYNAANGTAQLAIERSDEEDLLESPAYSCAFSDEPISPRKGPLVLLCRAGSSVAVPSTDARADRPLMLFEGPHMHTQFEQLMRLIRLEEERQRIHRLIAGPLAHDFRGAIGVVGLAAEVLKTSAQSAAIVKKLISSRVKLEALVQDLQLITTPDLFHPASLLKANLEVE